MNQIRNAEELSVEMVKFVIIEAWFERKYEDVVCYFLQNKKEEEEEEMGDEFILSVIPSIIMTWHFFFFFHSFIFNCNSLGIYRWKFFISVYRGT